MSITNVWSVTDCLRETADGYIKTAAFRIVGTDGTYSHTMSGKVDLERPETLIPYSEVTSDQAVDWIKEAITAEDPEIINKIEAAIETNINEQRQPTQATGVPWN